MPLTRAKNSSRASSGNFIADPGAKSPRERTAHHLTGRGGANVKERGAAIVIGKSIQLSRGTVGQLFLQPYLRLKWRWNFCRGRLFWKMSLARSKPVQWPIRSFF